MIPEVLPLFVCPQCSSRTLQWNVFDQRVDGRIDIGVLWCTVCRRWYPIEGGVLELLPDRLAYHADRQAFWCRHADRLRADRLTICDGERKREQESTEVDQQRHFDWYAANAVQTYNAYERLPFWQAVDGLTFDEWRKHIVDRSWLLDVGCGQGRSSSHIVDRDITVVGFDISKALVRQAHERFARNDTGARMMFFVGSASPFPLVDGSFDYVLVYGVLHHLADPSQACAEIARVLRPGGMYFGLENNVTVLRGLFELLQRICPAWHEEAGAMPLMSARDLSGWFAAAGLDVVAHSTVFVPPQVANLMGAARARRLIVAADTVLGRLPALRRQGGLLSATGTKRAA